MNIYIFQHYLSTECLQLFHLLLHRVSFRSNTAHLGEVVFGFLKKLHEGLKELVECHGLLHGVNEVRVALKEQLGNITPGVVQLLDRLLDFRLVRFPTKTNEFLASTHYLSIAGLDRLVQLFLQFLQCVLLRFNDLKIK